MRASKKIAFWAGIAAAAAAGGRASAAEPTFCKEIAPIFQAHCVECHRAGEIGPMPLLSYEEARPWLKSIKRAVETRQMPPWHADPSVGTWLNNRRMTDEEVATISRWIDGGAAKGDPADLPPPRNFESGWRIGQPDLILTASKEEVLPASLEDEYRYVNIPTGFEQERWIKAIESRPGNPRAVHHVIIFGREVGTQSKGIKNPFEGGIGGYAPGSSTVLAKPGQGIRVPAGTQLALQVHYHKEPGKEERDREQVGIQFCDWPVKTEILSGLVGDIKFRIPPGDPAYNVEAAFRVTEPIQLRSMMPHMHLRGESMTVWAELPGGERRKLIYVPRFDFNWQTIYEFAEPPRIPAGSTLRAVATFNNSKDNPHNPDPTKEVRFGLPTSDEMMFAFFGYMLDKETLDARDPSYHPAGGASGR